MARFCRPVSNSVAPRTGGAAKAACDRRSSVPNQRQFWILVLRRRTDYQRASVCEICGTAAHAQSAFGLHPSICDFWRVAHRMGNEFHSKSATFIVRSAGPTQRRNVLRAAATVSGNASHRMAGAKFGKCMGAGLHLDTGRHAGRGLLRP